MPPFGLEQGGSHRNGGGSSDRYKYNGKELDETTGHYFYGFRMYNPVVGRFTGVDPTADQFAHLSVYNYASNDPIKNIDLHGLQGVPFHAAPLKELKEFGESIVDKTKHTMSILSKQVDNTGNWLLNSVVGNDNISNTVDAVEVASEGKGSSMMSMISDASKKIAPILDVAEGVKIYVEVNSSDAEKSSKGLQDAGKFILEVGLSLSPAKAASIPANILIRNSRDGNVVTSPENIDRAAGAYEPSLNQTKQGLEIFQQLNNPATKKEDEEDDNGR